MYHTYVDIETTGLSPHLCQVIEFTKVETPKVPA